MAEPELRGPSLRGVTSSEIAGRGTRRSPFSTRSRFEAELVGVLLAQHDAEAPGDVPQIEARIRELRQADAADGAMLCELELLLLRLDDVSALAASLPDLRRRYAEVTGNPLPSAPADEDEPALRAQAAHLTVQIHRAYAANHAFEGTRQRMVALMFVTAILVITTAMIGLRWFSTDGTNTVFDVVMIGGVLGGFTSCLRRVYMMTRGVDPIVATQSLAASRTGMMAAPALGCVFAVAMHLCLVGGLVSGPLFPTLKLVESAGDGIMRFQSFLHGTVEAQGSDFAKLLIWSFIAGFAERLLPDLLDSFGEKARSRQDG